jgi:DNA polymerase-3 subunit alpha
VPYVPLHVHSVYSNGESLFTLADLVSRASFLGFGAVGLTDHGSTYGHYEFAEIARRAGIKPVFGAELQHASLAGAPGLYHLTVLAENNAGYRNLCSLVSLHSSRDRGGFVAAEELATHREGLIVLSGCIRGEAGQAVLHGTLGRARDVLLKLVEICGRGNFFVELMNHGTQQEALVAEQLVVLAGKADIGTVVTNNDRYGVKEDVGHYRISRLIGKKRPEDEAEPRAEEYYMKRERELRPLFAVGGDDVFERSGEIAERCAVDLPRAGRIAFSRLQNQDEALADRCRRRFKLAYHNRQPDERAHLARLVERELRSAREEGLAGFLLFMRQLVSQASARGIWIEIMGSPLLESVVAHCIEITPLDPADHDLFFESYSAAARGAPPPVEFITSEPKKEELVGIIDSLLPGYTPTYQMTREEMSLATIAKEVAEILGLPAELRGELARIRAFERRHRTLASLLAASPEVHRLYTAEPLARSALHAAYALQGRLFHATLDSSRIVILPREMDGFVSYVGGPAGDRFAKIGARAIESCGGWLIGIQHSHFLAAIAETVGLFRTRTGKDVASPGPSDARQWMPPALDDSHVYALMGSGETEGVYLLESQGIKDHLMRIKPSSFDELVNIISLYRPGPLEGGLWEKYLENAEKKGKVFLPHPAIASILAHTRGVLLYREQVREILEETAGLRGADAVSVERALRERDSGELMAARLAFIRGAMDAGTNEEDAQRIFDYLLHAIAFTHSKALSCAQASVSYRTAYLKAHAFERYFTALLNSNLGVKERLQRYLKYVRTKSVPVVPCGINADAVAFAYEEGAVRAPLHAVVAFEKGEWEAIVEERIWKGDFATLSDFLDRMKGRVSEGTVLELVGNGVFDDSGSSRDYLRSLCREFFHAEGGAAAAPAAPPRQGRGRKRRETDRQISLFDAESEAKPGGGGPDGGKAGTR